ncbi:MAG: hypothetical protein Q9220_003167 [cf. Caloplaca sp. 1 TL-2023]
MAPNTGPPQGTLKYMTPFHVAGEPAPPKPIPDVVHPEKRPAERAKERFSLADKRAIGVSPSASTPLRWLTIEVTGGAQGLGLVSARAMLEHGVSHLAILDVDEQQGRKACEHLHDLHADPEICILSRVVDVTDEAAVDSVVEALADKFGGIDLLVCFAGITGSELSVEYDIDRWRKIFDVNLHGSFLVARSVARQMIFRKTAGSIVFTASMSGYIVNTPQPHPAYAISKAGIHHLARSLAGEWVGHNIRVNSISPGIMNTRLSGGPAQADLRKLWLEKSPMGIGDPEDLTGAVILLCSEAGKFITGTDIKLDGLKQIFDGVPHAAERSSNMYNRKQDEIKNSDRTKLQGIINLEVSLTLFYRQKTIRKHKAITHLNEEAKTSRRLGRAEGIAIKEN